jgi:hypothetical protein
MTTTDLRTASGVLIAARALARVLADAAETATELRVTVIGGEATGVYVEVLPGVGDELDRLAEVDRLAALLGTEAELSAVANRFYYQAELDADATDTEGISVQVSALLAEVTDPAEASR